MLLNIFFFLTSGESITFPHAIAVGGKGAFHKCYNRHFFKSYLQNKLGIIPSSTSRSGFHYFKLKIILPSCNVDFDGTKFKLWLVDTVNLRNSSFDESILQYILVANNQTDISGFVIYMVTLVNMKEMQETGPVRCYLT